MSARRLHILLLRTLKNLLELIKGISKSRRFFRWIEAVLEDLIQEEDTLTEFYRIRFNHLLAYFIPVSIYNNSITVD